MEFQLSDEEARSLERLYFKYLIDRVAEMGGTWLGKYRRYKNPDGSCACVLYAVEFEEEEDILWWNPDDGKLFQLN